MEELAASGVCPEWLPSKLLDVALDLVADGEAEAAGAAREDAEASSDAAERKEERAKTQRLKKLLAAADKRLQQAEADLQVRDAEIAALKLVAGIPSAAAVTPAR